MKFSSVIAFLLYFLLVGFIFSQEKQPHYIQWKSVEGAAKYRVEIIDEQSRVIFDKTVKNNRVDFHIHIGKYSFRIGTIDSYNRLVKWSPWNDLVIKANARPEVKSERAIVVKESNPDSIVIKADKVTQATKATIISNGKKIPVIITPGKNNNVILTIPTEGLSKGEFQLELENPGFEKATMNVTVVDNKKEKEAIIGSSENIDTGVSDFDGEEVRKKEEENRAKIAEEKKQIAQQLKPNPGILPSWMENYFPVYKQTKNNRNLIGLTYFTGFVSSGIWALASVQENKVWHAYYNYNADKISNYLAQKAMYNKPDSVNDTYFHTIRYSRVIEARKGISVSAKNFTNGTALFAGFGIVSIVDAFFWKLPGSGIAQADKKGALWRSAILPGWGQMASNRPYSGMFFGSAFLSMALYSSAVRNEYMAWKRYYSGVTEEFNYLIVDQANKTQGEFLYGSSLEFASSTYVRSKIASSSRKYNASLGLMAVIYLANIADVYYFYGSSAKTSFYFAPEMDGASFGVFYNF